MSWFYAIDQEQKGPVSEEEFHQLVRAGTIKPKTLVWQEGMPRWVPYLEVAPDIASTSSGALICAECGKEFNPDELVRFENAYVCGSCKPTFVQRLQEGGQTRFRGTNLSEEEIIAAPYEVDIGDCLSRGWKATTANLGTAIGGMCVLGVLYIVGSVVMGILDELAMEATGLPFMPISALLTPFFAGPISGGFFMLGIAMIRNENAGVVTAMSGFSRYGSCAMCALVQTLLMFVCLVPVFIVAGLTFGMNDGSQGIGILVIMIAGLASICVMMYLTVCWLFSYHLIVDKGYGFWAAMSLSRRVVRRRWWMSFLFYFVAGFICSLGILLLVVGLLFTIPAFAGMLGALYEDNLGRLQPKPSVVS